MAQLSVEFCSLSLMGLPKKFISPFQSLYASNPGRVHTGVFYLELITRGGDSQDYRSSPFENVVEIKTKIFQSLCDTSSVDISLDNNLHGLE